MAIVTSPSLANDFPSVEKTFSNSRLLVGFYYLMSPVAIFMGLCMFIAVFTSIFPLSDFSAGNAIAAVLWLAGASSMAAIGISVWSYGQRLGFNQAQFETHGVAFQLGSKKAPQSAYFYWNQIAAVKHQRQNSVDSYYLVGRDGSSVQFNNYSFLSAKTIAREVAAHAGQSIQEM